MTETFTTVQPSLDAITAIWQAQNLRKEVRESLELFKSQGGTDALVALQKFIKDTYVTRMSGNTYELAQHSKKTLFSFFEHCPGNEVTSTVKMYLKCFYKAAAGHPRFPLEDAEKCVYCNMSFSIFTMPVGLVINACGCVTKNPKAWACMLCKVSEVRLEAPCAECTS